MLNKKTIWFIGIGLFFYLTDYFINPLAYFPSSGGRGYTLGAEIVILLSMPPILAILILGIPCLLVGLFRRSYAKPLLVFAILLFAASLFRIGQTVIITYVLQPKINYNLEQLINKKVSDSELEKSVALQLPEATPKCMELAEKKKKKLFGDLKGYSPVIYSKKLNTCIAGNIYGGGGICWALVVDLITDEYLLTYYPLRGCEEYNGLTWEETVKQFWEFGFAMPHFGD